MDIKGKTKKSIEGVFDKVQEAKIKKALALAEWAEWKLRPHVLYSARVFRTQGQVDDNNKWSCGIVHDGMGYSQRGVVWDSFGWTFSLPVATGPTPKAACEAFDKLWEEGC